MSKDTEPFNPFDKIIAYYDDKNEELVNKLHDFDTLKEQYDAQNLVGIAGLTEQLQKVCFESMFFNLLVAAKLKYIIRGASYCFTSNNVLGLASFARTTLEHVASYAHAINISSSTIENLTGLNNLEKANQYLSKFSNTLNISYYGSGNQKTQNVSSHKPIHINDCIKSLDSKFGDKHNYITLDEINYISRVSDSGISIDPLPTANIVQVDYNFLCDFVHPNYGSNYLVTTGILAEGSIDTPNKNVDNLKNLFAAKCLRYWKYYELTRHSDHRSQLIYSSWLERTQKKGAKVSRIFSKKIMKYAGDGKSANTAYSFPSARDKLEEMSMYNELLNQLKLAKHTRQYVSASEDHIVESFESSNGLLYFFKCRSFITK